MSYKKPPLSTQSHQQQQSLPSSQRIGLVGAMLPNSGGRMYATKNTATTATHNATFGDNISNVTSGEAGSEQNSLSSNASTTSSTSSNGMNEEEDDAQLGGGLLPGWDDAGIQAKTQQILNPHSVHIHRNGNIRVDTIGMNRTNNGFRQDVDPHLVTMAQRIQPKRIEHRHHSSNVNDDIVDSIQRRLNEEKARAMQDYRKRRGASVVRNVTQGVLSGTYNEQASVSKSISSRNRNSNNSNLNRNRTTALASSTLPFYGGTSNTRNNSKWRNKTINREVGGGDRNGNELNEVNRGRQRGVGGNGNMTVTSNTGNGKDAPRRVQVHTDGTVDIEFGPPSNTTAATTTSSSSNNHPETTTNNSKTSKTSNQSNTASTLQPRNEASIPLPTTNTTNTTNATNAIHATTSASPSLTTATATDIQENLKIVRDMQSSSLANFWQERKDNLKKTDLLLYGTQPQSNLNLNLNTNMNTDMITNMNTNTSNVGRVAGINVNLGRNSTNGYAAVSPPINAAASLRAYTEEMRTTNVLQAMNDDNMSLKNIVTQQSMQMKAMNVQLHQLNLR